MARAAVEARVIAADGREQRDLINRVLDASGDLDPMLEGSLLVIRGITYTTEGLDLERAEADARAAQRLLHPVREETPTWVGDWIGRLEAVSLFFRGEFAALQAAQPGPTATMGGADEAPNAVLAGTLFLAGDLRGAQTLYERGMERTRSSGSVFGQQVTAAGLGYLAILRGELSEAREHAETIAGSFSSSVLLAVCAMTEGQEPPPVGAPTRPGSVSELIRLGVSARALLASGDEAGARRLAADWVSLHQEAGFRFLTFGPLQFGAIPLSLVEETVARRFWEELGPLHELRVLSWESADAVVGELALQLGEVDAALERFNWGVEWCTTEGCPIELGRNLQGLAAVAGLAATTTRRAATSTAPATSSHATAPSSTSTRCSRRRRS